LLLQYMHYEQLIGVSLGLQVKDALYDFGLNVAGLEVVCRQCPPHYRGLTTLHMHRINQNMQKLVEEVGGLLRQTSATAAAAAGAASGCGSSR